MMLFLLVVQLVINFVQVEKYQLVKFLILLISLLVNLLYLRIFLAHLYLTIRGSLLVERLQMSLRQLFLILMLVMTRVCQKTIQL